VFRGLPGPDARGQTPEHFMLVPHDLDPAKVLRQITSVGATTAPWALASRSPRRWTPRSQW
jgi:hypothetical protein